MKYLEIYRRRLNKYGTNTQERIQGQREKNFEIYLSKSTNLVVFTYEDTEYKGSLERYKQDETRTLQYLLTPISTILPPGVIIDFSGIPFMVFYLEDIQASGYNRYIMLHMSHTIQWGLGDNKLESLAYVFGSMSANLRDIIGSSDAKRATAYMIDENYLSVILPKNRKIKKEDFVTINYEGHTSYFRVTGYDRQSTSGVQFVTLNPIYKYDESPVPADVPGAAEETFWFNGGE